MLPRDAIATHYDPHPTFFLFFGMQRNDGMVTDK
jgi:hypothetical protein